MFLPWTHGFSRWFSCNFLRVSWFVWRCHLCQAARFAGASGHLIGKKNWIRFYSKLFSEWDWHLAMRYEIALVTAAYFRELLGKKQGVLYEDHQAGDLYGVDTWSTVGVVGNRPSYPTSSFFLVDAVRRCTNLHPSYAKSQCLLCRFFNLY